jgi:hypothetical protein
MKLSRFLLLAICALIASTQAFSADSGYQDYKLHDLPISEEHPAGLLLSQKIFVPVRTSQIRFQNGQIVKHKKLEHGEGFLEYLVSKGPYCDLKLIKESHDSHINISSAYSYSITNISWSWHCRCREGFCESYNVRTYELKLKGSQFFESMHCVGTTLRVKDIQNILGSYFKFEMPEYQIIDLIDGQIPEENSEYDNCSEEFSNRPEDL